MITIQDVQIIAHIAEKFGTSAGERYLTAIVQFCESNKALDPVVLVSSNAPIAQNEFTFPLNDSAGSMATVSIDHIKSANRANGVGFARDAHVVPWIKSFRIASGMGLLEAKRCHDALIKDKMLQF